MQFTKFAKKLGRPNDITQLMHDLGDALTKNPDMIFMGGGNPARIESVEEIFHQRVNDVIADDKTRHKTLGIYQPPQGDHEFLVNLAKLLKNKLGWNVTDKNIAVSNGSQAAFFSLFNMLGGEAEDGSHRYIHLPMAPEYIGYTDTGIHEGLFQATKPTIEMLDDHLFKYHVDFDHMVLTDHCGALCVSRPTNPTGNVLGDDEMEHLDKIAKAKGIPLIIDGAYGLPFPNILFTDATPYWNENTIVVLSLSKLGLPGVRTGIVVASEEVIDTYTRMTTVMNLASSVLGPSIANQLIANDELLPISNDHIRPFYKAKAERAVQIFNEALGDLPWAVHQPEGAIFLWLWFRDLPVPTAELYQRLKARGVLVVPGEGFFPGLAEDWRHKQECVRVTYAQPEAQVKEGARIIAEEVRALYAQAS